MKKVYKYLGLLLICFLGFVTFTYAVVIWQGTFKQNVWVTSAPIVTGFSVAWNYPNGNSSGQTNPNVTNGGVYQGSNIAVVNGTSFSYMVNVYTKGSGPVGFELNFADNGLGNAILTGPKPVSSSGNATMSIVANYTCSAGNHPTISLTGTVTAAANTGPYAINIIVEQT